MVRRCWQRHCASAARCRRRSCRARRTARVSRRSPSTLATSGRPRPLSDAWRPAASSWRSTRSCGRRAQAGFSVVRSQEHYAAVPWACAYCSHDQSFTGWTFADMHMYRSLTSRHACCSCMAMQVTSIHQRRNHRNLSPAMDLAHAFGANMHLSPVEPKERVAGERPRRTAR